MYINVHSHYSLRFGTLSIERLIALAQENHIEQLALTDINNSTGAIEFVKACTEAGIKPVVGIEFRKKNELLYIGIARNNEGFRELNDFLTYHNLNETELPTQAPILANVFFIFPFGYEVNLLKENEYIGIRYTQLNKLFGKPMSKLKEKLIALQPVSIENKEEYELHTFLRAIDANTLISKLAKNNKAEIADTMLSLEELQNKFESYPFLLKNTEKLLQACSFEFNFSESKNRKTFTGSKEDDRALLEKLALDGLQYRYGKKNKLAAEKVKYELEVINQLNFSSYFLITWDIIRYSMSRGYYHVGRGSGANSVVAYCMRITDVDPIELDLYFERFLNPKRSSPPDFDIDYSWDERDTVVDYIFKRYGHQHTALLGTMTTFKDRSIFRELGKVVGLPKTEIDQLLHPSSSKKNDSELVARIHKIGELMLNMPNQRSIHACGIIISEKPITYYTALDLPPKGLPTVQWDMYAAEEIGFEKFDILSQRGIGHIKEAAQLIKENKKINVDVHAIQDFKKDEKIKVQLRSANSIGCFYVESPAMRGLLRKLRCDNYISLVAASSIIRPGVAKSGMMKQYITRFHHPDKIDYLHPVMKDQLAETYGVMVYQEDVIKVCHHYAGLDLADADVLRRAMSGKYRSSKELNKLIQRFFECAKALGRDETITQEIWRQVYSFAGYSFSKAHSASFAVESYQSLFLKTYYPHEFMVAVLNNYGGFYNRWLYLQETLKAGAKLHLPCINHSIDKVGISGDQVWLGFIGILGLEQKNIDGIMEERLRNGPYLSLMDFTQRYDISLEQTIILIRVGAFRFTNKKKKELLWEVHQYLGQKKVLIHSEELFGMEEKEMRLPALTYQIEEDAFDEIELLGFPISQTYFDLLRTQYRAEINANDLLNHLGQTVKMLGCFVTYKPVRTIRKEMMYFGTFLDLDGNFFDTTHFPNTSTVFPFKGNGCYLILGKVVEEFGFPSLEIIKFEKLPIRNDPRIN